MPLAYFFLGLVVGGVVGWVVARRSADSSRVPQGDARTKLITREQEEKAKNVDKVLALFASSDSLTNNDVEQALGVSDATAERYLNELERQGKIRQIGKTGRSVTYKRLTAG